MKTILVSGSSSGIGLEICIQASDLGLNVLAISRNIEPLEGILNLKANSVDITNDSQIEAYVKKITSENIKIDILINNAGFLIKDSFKKTTYEIFKQTYDVNVFGLASLTRALLPIINKDGQVINIASVGGLNASKKFPGLSAYSSSKGAVITLTEVLAEEYRSGPRFNCLALGSVQTEMLRKAFPGYEAKVMPSDMAKQILDFALDESSLPNGEIIKLDKGNLE
jgi:NAD(P)-dependent dehydrogenase (short-subunit alcohol dehydrogenase family)